MDFKKLIYKYDYATNTTRISKTKAITIAVFVIFFIWSFPDFLKEGILSAIFSSIIVGLIFAVPTFIVGFIISKIINSVKKDNKTPAIKNNAQTPETTTIKKENENLVLNEAGSDETIEEQPTMKKLNTNQYTLVGVKCPRCGSGSYTIRSVKRAERKYMDYSYSTPRRAGGFGIIGGAIINGVIDSYDDLDAESPFVNWKLKISFKCLDCNKKFTIPEKSDYAGPSEILEKPYEITLKRLPNDKSSVHYVWLNGIEVGQIKNDEEITFYTHVETNVLFVTDKYGKILINQHGDLFKDHYRFIAQSGGSQRIVYKTNK